MLKTFSQFRSELPVLESQEYFAEDFLSEDLLEILLDESYDDMDRIVSVFELYSREAIELSEEEIDTLVSYYQELEEATWGDVGKAALGAGARLAKKYSPAVVQAGKSVLSKAGSMAKSALSSAGSKIKSAFTPSKTPGTSVVPVKAPTPAKSPSKLGGALKNVGKTAAVAGAAGTAGYLAGKSSSGDSKSGSASMPSAAPKAAPKSAAPKVAPKSAAPKVAPKSAAPKASSGGNGIPDDVRDAAKNMLGATRGAAGATGNMVNKMKAIPGTDRMNKPSSSGGQSSSKVHSSISKLGGEPAKAAPKPAAPKPMASTTQGAPRASSSAPPTGGKWM
jgi:hypothetical protein